MAYQKFGEISNTESGIRWDTVSRSLLIGDSVTIRISPSGVSAPEGGNFYSGDGGFSFNSGSFESSSTLWSIYTSGHLVPTSSNFTLGRSTSPIGTVYTSNISGSDYLNLATSGSNRWYIDPSGSFRAVSSGQIIEGQDITLQSNSGVVNIRGEAGLNLKVAGWTTWTINNQGALVPGYTNSGVIGSSSIPVSSLYLDKAYTSEIYSKDSRFSLTKATSGSVIFSTSDEFQFDIDGTPRWIITNNSLRPATSGTSGSGIYDIGTTQYQVRDIRLTGEVYKGGVKYSHPFTGIHLYYMADGEDIEIGDAVKLNSNGLLQVCNSGYDPSCIGVMTGIVEHVMNGAFPYDSIGKVLTDRNLHCIASLGDSFCDGLPGVKVSDENGQIKAGDYLVTSSGKPGFLMKQTGMYPTLIHNYTIAYSPMDIETNENGENLAAYVYFCR